MTNTGNGALDVNGVWQYGEADSFAAVSDMLNVGQQSVSTAIAALGSVVDRRRIAFTAISALLTTGSTVSGTYSVPSLPYATVIQLEFFGGVTDTDSTQRSFSVAFASTAGTLTNDVSSVSQNLAAGRTAAAVARGDLVLPASTTATISLIVTASTASAMSLAAGNWRATRSIL